MVASILVMSMNTLLSAKNRPGHILHVVVSKFQHISNARSPPAEAKRIVVRIECRFLYVALKKALWSKHFWIYAAVLVPT